MDRITKPRVFLSHSKKDIAFIERLERELRKCQIEPWLDDIELRHGKPWLDAIFEDGIPSCDAVLVYFTENSLASKVVKKELDAGVVSKLEDESVALLPYVEATGLREKLRSDIRTLHVPEWNSENFETTLSRCVAEIWRSFHERRVSQAIAQEKVKRMEAEKALEKSADQLEITYCGLTYNEMKERIFGPGDEMIASHERHVEVIADYYDEQKFISANNIVEYFEYEFEKKNPECKSAENKYLLEEYRTFSTYAISTAFSRLEASGLVEEDDLHEDRYSLTPEGHRFFNRYRVYKAREEYKSSRAAP